jgi:protease-4
MDVGAGGAYYLAVHSDAIIAHPTSIVGGIGVILNIYNLEDTLGQFNIVSIPIKAGDQIDIASPERAMNKRERATLQKIADSFHARFIALVKSVRPNSADNKENFEGGILTGADAMAEGLIDDVGYLDDALALARTKSNLAAESPVVMLRRESDRAYSQFDVTPNTPYSLLPIKMPGLDRSSLPTFLYLWQPDPSFLTTAGG